MIDTSLLYAKLLEARNLMVENQIDKAYKLINNFFNQLKIDYPITANRTMVSIHYANNFSCETLKNISFILDEMNVFLYKHKIIERNTASNYFNDILINEIPNSLYLNASKEYEKNMVILDFTSLLYAIKEKSGSLLRSDPKKLDG